MRDDRAAAPGPAAAPPLETLRRRRDFVAASRAQRQATPGFTLQARQRRPDEGAGAAIRVGFTCSRKLGNAVARNRAKRRLRAIARAVMPLRARPGWDYVLVGRAGASAARPFALLIADLEEALARVHAPRRPA